MSTCCLYKADHSCEWRTHNQMPDESCSTCPAETAGALCSDTPDSEDGQYTPCPLRMPTVGLGWCQHPELLIDPQMTYPVSGTCSQHPPLRRASCIDRMHGPIAVDQHQPSDHCEPSMPRPDGRTALCDAELVDEFRGMRDGGAANAHRRHSTRFPTSSSGFHMTTCAARGCIFWHIHRPKRWTWRHPQIRLTK